MKIKRVIFGILSTLLPMIAMAENDSVEVVRPVASSYELGIGSSKIVDTYLTPLEYDGAEFNLRYERRRAMKFNPNRWVMRLTSALTVDRTENPARNATMWYAGLEMSWGMMHRWKLPHNITLAGGGSTSVDVGCLYSARNGNNPASAKAAWTMNLTGEASWVTQLAKRRLILRYQPTIPFIGAFFAPDYGELYYEIYLGNDSGLCHTAWWGNYFKMENLFTADWYLGKATALRLGYRGGILSTKVNDVVTRMISHSFIVGVSGEWISIVPGKSLHKDTQVISAIY